MKNLIIKIALFIFCLLLQNMNVYSQMFVQQGVPTSIICIQNVGDFGVGTWNWSFSPCSGDVTTNNQSFNVNNITINSNCCSITSQASGDLVDIYNNQFFFLCQETLKILPKINAVSGTKFPGNTFVVDASSGGSSSNGLNCASAHGCPGATITWGVTGASFSNCFFNPCINVTVPNPPTSNVITINGTYNCGGINSALPPITVNVSLQNPTVSGPQSIGCGSNPNYVMNSQVTYNATSVTGSGSSNWSWTWPSFMSPVGSTNGQSIVLSVNGTGSGNVTAQAFSPNGQVSSAVANYPVNVCCIPFINETTVLNSSNTGYLVESGSTIHSTNDIQSTGTATMHASVEVRLMPGFNSVSGSQVHLYTAPCNSGYSRMSLNQYTTEPVINSNGSSTDNSTNTSDTKILMSKAELDTKKNELNANYNDGFTISPNPTNGKITIMLNEEIEAPIEVSVINAVGNIIYSSNRIVNNKIIVDLSEFANGMYIVKTFYNNKVISKVLMKTE